jgi:hypothetical protein
MKWVTRRGIRVNRLATAWLVRRFIDPDAVFVFCEPHEVVAVQNGDGAVGFDAPGARYPHRDEHDRCSFEALVEERCSEDDALRRLAAVVHAADFADAIDREPEAVGLRAISRGFPLVAENDQEIVEKGAFLYDALYASLHAPREAT